MKEIIRMGATGRLMKKILMPLLTGCSLFQKSVFEDEERAIQFLANNRTIDIRISSEDNKTILHWAAMKPHTTIIRRLLEVPQHRCLLNSSELFNGETPMTLAVKYGPASTTEALIDAGADINSQNFNREVALYWAIRRR